MSMLMQSVLSLASPSSPCACVCACASCFNMLQSQAELRESSRSLMSAAYSKHHAKEDCNKMLHVSARQLCWCAPKPQRSHDLCTNTDHR